MEEFSKENIRDDLPGIRIDDFYVQIRNMGFDEKDELFVETLIYRYEKINKKLEAVNEENLSVEDYEKINKVITKVIQEILNNHIKEEEKQ